MSFVRSTEKKTGEGVGANPVHSSSTYRPPLPSRDAPLNPTPSWDSTSPWDLLSPLPDRPQRPRTQPPREQIPPLPLSSRPWNFSARNSGRRYFANRSISSRPIIGACSSSRITNWDGCGDCPPRTRRPGWPPSRCSRSRAGWFEAHWATWESRPWYRATFWPMVRTWLRARSISRLSRRWQSRAGGGLLEGGVEKWKDCGHCDVGVSSQRRGMDDWGEI